MGCFSFEFFIQLAIWLVAVGAIFAIIRLVMPAVLANFGGPGTLLAQVINIVLWALLMIAVLILTGDLVSCLVGAGGIHLPRVR